MSLHPDSSHRSNPGRDGFTLVEVLVALALLTTALIPAFVLANNAVNLSYRIRNSLIASNLAQEGVEVVRAIRDSNWINGVPFDQGLSSCGGGCSVQYDSVAVPVVGVPASAFLKLDTTTGLYQYDTGTNTLFSRTVTITVIPPFELMKVVSEVAWKERSIDKKMSLEYYLFDWVK